jgi:anti-sigma regulatory factor (Ser/Thr protein kinase)/serine/threonine protein phosphatase PrpC
MAEDLGAPLQIQQSVTIPIKGLTDQRRATECALQLSSSAGFSATERDEIVLALTELMTNVVEHASGGTITLSSVEQQGRRGLRMESEDAGPGISDAEQAMTDRYSTAGSLGIGLGTINRLMDDLQIHSRAPTGAHIICYRWKRPEASRARPNRISFGVASRSYRCQPQNGDAFIVKQWDSNALAGVIDGLGHGQYAQRASQAARHYVEQHFDQPLANLFRGAGRACQATRGVVMALARFDLERQKVSLASVGNVDVRLFGSPDRFNLIVRRGIIGLNAPSPVPSEYSWTSNCVLIMHSDGLRTRWDWEQFRDCATDSPTVIARRLLQVLGKLEDDATVIVARNSGI